MRGILNGIPIERITVIATEPHPDGFTIATVRVIDGVLPDLERSLFAPKGQPISSSRIRKLRAGCCGYPGISVVRNHHSGGPERDTDGFIGCRR